MISINCPQFFLKKCLLTLDSSRVPTLALTFVASNKSSLSGNEVLLSRYFFTSNAAFFKLLLLTFTAGSVIAFFVPYPGYFRNRLSHF